MPAALSLRTASFRTSAPRELWTGLAAYGSSDLAVRAVRLGTTLIIARRLAPELVGEAAIALTLFEIIRVLARNGIGQAIIACPAERLAATCNRAHRLFWRVSFGLVAIQCLAGVALATLFDHGRAGAMLAMLSLVYLLMPGGLVQVHLAMREGLAGRTARNAAAQTGLDHVLTAALLLAFPSPWSLALPKLLTAPLWLVLSRRSRPWRPDPAAGEGPIPGLGRMAPGVLGTEAMVALRSNGDNLIVAALLGTTALGTYYFAFSAGLGIASALVTAIGNTVFPLLCRVEVAHRRGTMASAILVAGAGGALAICGQAALAPFYVPILFGAHWAFAGPLVAVISLAGLAQLSQALLGSWLRASGRAPVEAVASLMSCAGALGGLTIGAGSGSLLGAAAGLTVGQWAAAALSIALFANRPTRKGAQS